MNRYKIGILLLPLCSSVAYAKLNVFACEPEWAALTRILGGDMVKVYSATTAQQNPHYIQARPSLIAKVSRADLLVCAGAELEVGWLPLLLRKSGNSNVHSNNFGYFMAADSISLLEKPATLDRSLGDIHASGNPHFHLDPYRMIQIANALSTRLGQIDSVNNDLYQKNLLKFKNEWQQAILRWEQKTKILRGKHIVVSHNSWIYLEKWLGLIKVATLESKPGIPPTSRHLSKVIAQLKKNTANIILYADYQNDKSANWLSSKTGIRTVGLPFSPAIEENLIQWFDRLLNQLLNIDL
jgi:zinc/manganese transport system substrate-binding protein